MAQEQDITFITEDIPGATSFIQSGKGLRLSYVSRQEAKYINDILLQNAKTPTKQTDPTKITPEFWGTIRESWKKEALVRYPDEGDYKVWIIDPKTGDPVAIGELVEFIGGDIRETPGGQPCKEYIVDLSGADIPDPDSYYVVVTYEDCYLKPQRIVDVARTMEGLTICVGRGIPQISIGVLIEGVVCDLNYGITECSEYSWDLTGVPEETIVSANFTDCKGNVDKLEGTIKDLKSPVVFCAEKDSVSISDGALTYVGLCAI